MEILYITTDDILRNSSANIRNASLVRGLEDAGNKVTVLCLKRNTQDSHLKKILENIDIQYIFGTENAAYQKENKTPSIKKQLKSIAIKLYNQIRIYDPLARLVRKVTKESIPAVKPDVIISSSDPRSSHLLAEKIIKLIDFKGKYIQYWGDPMLNDISSSFLMRPFLRMAEKRLLMLADLVVYTNDATILQMEQTYGISSDKMTSIPTPCASSEENHCQSANSEKGQVSIGYFGEYYSTRRDIMPLINAITGSNNYSLTIAGATDVKLPDNPNIKCFPKISAAQVAELQNDTDILIVLENKPKNTKSKQTVIQIPGKVFHYGVTNKKVLIIEETGLSKTAFDKYNRYYFCHNNVTDIANALKFMVADKDVNKSRPMQEFTPTSVASQLINKINTL